MAVQAPKKRKRKQEKSPEAPPEILPEASPEVSLEVSPEVLSESAIDEFQEYIERNPPPEPLEASCTSKLTPPEWQEVYQQFDDTQRQAFEEISRLDAAPETQRLENAWRIGQIVKDIATQEKGAPLKQQKSFMARCAKLLDKAPTELYKMREFYASFEEEADLKKLLELRVRGTNQPLGYKSYVIFTLRKSFTHEQRWELLESAANRGVSSKVFQAELKSVLGTLARSSRSASGRPTQVGKTPKDQIDHALTHLARLSKYVDGYLDEETGLLPLLLKTEIKELREQDYLKPVRVGVQSAEKLINQLHQFVRVWNKIAPAITKKLAQEINREYQQQTATRVDTDSEDILEDLFASRGAIGTQD